MINFRPPALETFLSGHLDGINGSTSAATITVAQELLSLPGVWAILADKGRPADNVIITIWGIISWLRWLL